MLLDAAREFEFDLSKSFMLGDHRSDILAGKAAGAKTILVRTANNQDEAPEADFQADSLTEAVEYII
jgi:D-glycero-D-manno-heptose 1,7-bisphosphate phosphatase